LVKNETEVNEHISITVKDIMVKFDIDLYFDIIKKS